MTTTEIIDHLRSDVVLASEALSGVGHEKREVFMRYYGINRPLSSVPMLAKQYHKSQTTIHQWVNSVTYHLRSPQRVRLIRDYLEDRRRRGHWFWGRWDWVVGHVIKNIKARVQGQTRNIAGS